MNQMSRQAVGVFGALFVSACCLGAAPLIVSAAAVVGLGAVRHVFNIFVLGPLMTLSVGWIAWNLARQARVLGIAARRYPPFWGGLLGGLLVWAGVVLPHVVGGTRDSGTALIIGGLPLLIAASAKALWDQRRATTQAEQPMG